MSEIESEVSGNFRKVLLSLLKNPFELESYQLMDAMDVNLVLTYFAFPQNQFI